MTDHEPGTVAAITLENGALIGRALRTSDRGWRVPSCGDFYYDREVADVRPLIVLDLDGYEWLPNRLRIDGERMGGVTGQKMRELADQIEAQMKPPKPAEPTGLGAVVEDARGRQWARAIDGEAPWCRRDGGARWVGWEHVDAVRVLSEGVTD